MALWTPEFLDMELWLDASDASTITGTSTASQWRDKSGKDRHCNQGNSSYQPAIVTNALNGLTTLSFDGSDDTLTGTTLPSMDNVSIFAVISGGSVSANQERGIFAIDNGATNGWETGFWWERSTYSSADTLNNYISSTGFNGGALNPGTATSAFSHRVIDYIHTKDVETTTYMDGVVGATTTTGVTLKTVPSYGYYIGRTELKHSGQIAELIVISDILIGSTRQIIEGYLAWKWGLTANLPVNHPYKSVRPTIYPKTEYLQVSNCVNSRAKTVTLSVNAATGVTVQQVIYFNTLERGIDYMQTYGLQDS